MGEEKEEKKKMTPAEAGKLGGEKTREKYGPEHYKQISEGTREKMKKFWQLVKDSK